MVLTGMLTPTVTLLAFTTVSDGAESTQLSVFAGAITLAVLFETQNKVASNFSFMRQTGALDFFGSLPLRREALIVGTAAAFFLLAVPAVVVTTAVGWTMLDVTISLQPLWLVPFVLAIAVFTGLGAIIGSMSSSIEQSSSISLGATVLLTSAGPVIIDPGRLPDWLNVVGYVNPAALGSDSLRAALTGTHVYDGAWVITMLSVATIAVWLLVGFLMPWRGRRQ
ncbi:ABC transporter permease [Pseudonocardia sp. HH130629-09]|uniref:ABC transporter permease n=1 Tax=Pseudonocardia sp. HH130629-09 TaxID=1641402 RepID=UPI001439032F|nr:ABC transporter permease [Pseudonocardia sp. HH130629-09]